MERPRQCQSPPNQISGQRHQSDQLVGEMFSDLPPPSPPAEKTAARQDQTRQASTDAIPTRRLRQFAIAEAIAIYEYAT
jgi:hypothetical protein